MKKNLLGIIFAFLTIVNVHGNKVDYIYKDNLYKDVYYEDFMQVLEDILDDEVAYQEEGDESNL